MFTTKLDLFYTRVFFLVTTDGSLVLYVSFDMIWKYIDGFWTVTFPKHVMLCFTWPTVSGSLSIFTALY